MEYKSKFLRWFVIGLVAVVLAMLPGDHAPTVATAGVSSDAKSEYAAASAVRAQNGGAASGQGYHSNSDDTIYFPWDGNGAVTMAPNSDVRVNHGTDRSRLQLTTGMAIFKAAPDSHRPLSVRVGEVQASSTGGTFAIQAAADSTTVVVSEGSVVLTDERSGWKLVLRANEQARLVRSTRGMSYEKVSVTPAAVRKAMSWRSHQATFAGMTGAELIEAMSVVAQHSGIRVEVDSKLAHVPVRGRVVFGKMPIFLGFLRDTRGIIAFYPDPADHNLIRLVPDPTWVERQ